MRCFTAFVASFAMTASVAAPMTYCEDAAGLIQVRKDRVAWRAKLQQRQYAELDTFFGALQKEYEAGKTGDSRAMALFAAFEDARPELTPHFEAWVKQYPRSYAARRAYAGHLYQVAWSRRGYSWTEDAGAEKKESMRQLLDRMMDVLNEADAYARKPTLSYPMRILAVRVLAGPLATREVFQRAESLDPLNVESKVAFVVANSPKWKGSRERMEEVAVNSAAWPPELAKAVGYEMFLALGEGYELAKKDAEAIRMFESAAANCPAYPAPLIAAIRLHKKVDNQEGVRAAAERYVALVPEQSWGYVQLASAESRLRLYPQSFKHYSKAADLGDRYGLEGLAWHYAGGHGVPQDLDKALNLYLKVNEQGGTHVQPQIEKLRKALGRP